MAKRMSMRDKLRGKLKDRTKESNKNRDSSNSLKNYFDPDKMEGITLWWADKDDHIIDVIPYFAGSKDPRNSKGEPAYVLDIEVHRFVGPKGDMVVCPEQYGKPCPICEESRRLNDEKADWKTKIKPLKPGRRAVYNIIVRDGGDMEKKGNQVFEIAHWFMEKHLAKIAKDPRGGGYTVFSDPDEGRSISFERTGVGKTNTDYTGHRFVDRPEVITDDELDAAVCLDELLELKTYDEIYEIFFGKDEDATDDTPDDTPDDEFDDEFDDSDDSDDDYQELPPTRTPKKKPRKKRKLKSKPKSEPECPHGHVIGDDVDEYEECDDCILNDECNDIADTI